MRLVQIQLNLQWDRQLMADDHPVSWDLNTRRDLEWRHQILSTEWTLHMDVCRQLWRVWGYPTVDLFATYVNYRIPNFVSSFQDLQAIATDAV
ncbi:hypothetical protein E2C01_086721 [Portunus trituberculatus]|uniref:Uncharacterized protein n=1 Tax=Portunus trituberculatus TaxID=210409 RepID=A0A5B7JFE2_PORTR|nr:hypothetical protein [Portunus trituberculatus]